MNRQNQRGNLAKEIERIQDDASNIAADAHALILLTGPEAAPASGGSLRRGLRRLQTRVDRLRRTLWKAQRGAETPVLPFHAANPAGDPPPSLVDRVFSIIDRRRG